jgi:hypothetical protein
MPGLVNIFQLNLRSENFDDDDDDNNNNNNYYYYYIASQVFPIGCTFILLEKEILRKNTNNNVRPKEGHAFVTFSDNAEHCSYVTIFLFIASMY